MDRFDFASPHSHSLISPLEVWQARKRIAPMISKTPLIRCPYLSEQFQASIYYKLEHTHAIGAFKVRGAANKILRLSSKEQQRGVTTFSTGNHGQAVAYVAKQLGIRAVICISRRVPKTKVDAIQRWGAELHFYGQSQDEAADYCEKLQKEQGLTVIPPFDDLDVIAGQGTIGLEIVEELPQVDAAIIPLSGGGLLAGIGFALKSISTSIQVTGVSMEQSAVMIESLKAGKPVTLPEADTLADSLLGGIGERNQHTFSMVKQYMDQSVRVSEEAIAKGMATMFQHQRLAIEGAAATPIAALLAGKIEAKGKTIVLIITGNNVDIATLLRVVGGHHSSVNE